MSKKDTLVGHFDAPHVSLGSYVTGFVTCVVLTLLAFFAATFDKLNATTAIALVAVLAIVQCIVQLRRFLHLGTEFKPRWKLAVFILMLVIVLIVVIGSLWIMDNLNYYMMESPRATEKYLDRNGGF